MSVLPTATFSELRIACSSGSFLNSSWYHFVLKPCQTSSAFPLLNEWATMNPIGRNKKMRTITVQTPRPIDRKSMRRRFVGGGVDGDRGHAGATAGVMSIPRALRMIARTINATIAAIRDRAEDDEDQQHRHRRSERPVLRREELRRHERSGHVALRSTEHAGRDVVTGEGDEHQQQAGDDAGHRERQGDLA